MNALNHEGPRGHLPEPDQSLDSVSRRDRQPEVKGQVAVTPDLPQTRFASAVRPTNLPFEPLGPVPEFSGLTSPLRSKASQPVTFWLFAVMRDGLGGGIVREI
jgi:hypothetical protein